MLYRNRDGTTFTVTEHAVDIQNIYKYVQHGRVMNTYYHLSPNTDKTYLKLKQTYR